MLEILLEYSYLQIGKRNDGQQKYLHACLDFKTDSSGLDSAWEGKIANIQKTIRKVEDKFQKGLYNQGVRMKKLEDLLEKMETKVDQILNKKTSE